MARDPEVSGMGATPLHVAALFGHTNIVRYLGARFPETLNARDNNGKTPLHYAATIKDNGHYYNLLTNLGANAAIKDLVINIQCKTNLFIFLLPIIYLETVSFYTKITTKRKYIIIYYNYFFFFETTIDSHLDLLSFLISRLYF